MAPNFLSNFHPFKWVANIKMTTVDSKEIVEYVNPNERRAYWKLVNNFLFSFKIFK